MVANYVPKGFWAGLSGWQIVGYNANGPTLDPFHPGPTRKTNHIPDLLANLHPIPTNVLMICYIKPYRLGYSRIVARFIALMLQGFPLQMLKRGIREV